MRSISKKKYFLVFVLGIVILPGFALFLSPRSVIAMWNGKRGEGNELYGEIGKYKFELDYGTHDWICDTAVRLIYEEGGELYRSKLKWLYDPSLYINFYLFDDTTNSDWWYTKDAKTTALKGGYYVYCPGEVTYTCGSEDMEERFLIARRYMRMLYWSGYVDRKTVGKNMYYPESRKGLPSGEAIPLTTRNWIVDSPGSIELGKNRNPHSLYFIEDKNEKDRWIPQHWEGVQMEKGFAAVYTMSSALDAVEFLNHEEKSKLSEDIYHTRKGKSEAAAS